MPSIRNRTLIFVVMAYATFLSTFNETILNIAFSSIMVDFDVPLSTVQWLATAYMLGAAVMVPISAFGYRSIPTRTLFIIITLLLILGSVIAGFAVNFPLLLIGRIIQALGSGLLIPTSLNIVIAIAPREKLGSYLGIMAAMTTIGISSAIILSGLLLAVFSWHVLPLLFGVLVLVCLIGGAYSLSNVVELTKPRLDPLSVVLVAFSLIGILYGISTVFSGSMVLALASFVIGIVCLVLFVRRQGRSDDPLIDLSVLRVRPFAIVVVINMLALLVTFSMNIVIPTFLQSVMGYDALFASLTMFPGIVLACVAAPVAGRTYDRRGIRGLLPTGFILMGVFLILLGLFIGTDIAALRFLIYVPIACGALLITGPAQSFGLSKLTPEQNPFGVIVLSTGFQIAGCVGSSLFTGVYSAISLSGISAGLESTQAYEVGFFAIAMLAVIAVVVGLILTFRLFRYITPEKSDQVDPSLLAVMETDVFTLPDSATVLEAFSLFLEKGTTGAPVVDEEGTVVGFVSDGDIVQNLRRRDSAFQGPYSFLIDAEDHDLAGKLETLMQLPITDIATSHVIGVDLHDDFPTVCKVFSKGTLKKVPVFDEGQMVGIVNRSEIMRYSIETYLGNKAADA
ncbi:MAG: MFS transporter [Coriobacteriaceae bacterium]|nr:MFS transporter [Coriobacteriaceae bacterium]